MKQKQRKTTEIKPRICLTLKVSNKLKVSFWFCIFTAAAAVCYVKYIKLSLQQSENNYDNFTAGFHKDISLFSICKTAN